MVVWLWFQGSFFFSWSCHVITPSKIPTDDNSYLTWHIPSMKKQRERLKKRVAVTKNKNKSYIAGRNRTCISPRNILYFLAITLAVLPAATSIDISRQTKRKKLEKFMTPCGFIDASATAEPWFGFGSVLRSSDDWNASERHGNRIRHCHTAEQKL